jgi:initiation factor 1A
MPINVKGGNKAKKGKNSQPAIVAKEIVYPDKSGYQFYAIMEQYLGHTSNMVMLRETKDEKGKLVYSMDRMLGFIRGKILKKCKPKKGDVFLVCTRDFAPTQVDIIHKYTEENIRDLRRDGTFPIDFIKLVDAFSSAESNASSKSIQQIKDEEAEIIEFDELYEQPEHTLDFSSSEEEETD